MLPIKVALRSMLSLPVLREADLAFTITLGIIAYIGIIWIVLKTFQYNKTRH
ncbi:hypothetical protein [Parafilimonas sp.]|jgi:hypothetical protein|uniref:hypothetical protein n=1 Tax=Parafilimonas sp. TaxID=1969739 RepID=UPI003F7E231C